MKINICFNLTSGAAGGGNQFLRAFKEFCLEKDCYTSISENADVILFNSHQLIAETINLKKENSSAVFVHRIDGPIRLYNSMSDKRDLLTNAANKIIADATIFQSNWSRTQNYKLGFKLTPFETTIINSSDQTIFNKKNKIVFSCARKVRLIATSWSVNRKKGFDIYRWLDQNLDFSLYEMSFVGNSPIEFNNIKHIQPLDSKKLAFELCNHDIYITASQKESCSNSLIEAMLCGLPSIALSDGGNNEIVGKGGELFEKAEEINGLLEKIIANYEDYQSSINLLSIEEVGNRYLEFFQKVLNNAQTGEYVVKKIGVLKICWLNWVLIKFKIYSVWQVKMKNLLKKVNLWKL